MNVIMIAINSKHVLASSMLIKDIATREIIADFFTKNHHQERHNNFFALFFAYSKIYISSIIHTDFASIICTHSPYTVPAIMHFKDV